MSEKFKPNREQAEGGISEVQRLESELKEVDAQYEKEGITPELRTTLAFMLGSRPAGGPYELTINDDARFKTFKEYKLGMKLTEYPSDEHDEKEYPEGRVVFEGGVNPAMIDKYQELEKRRWEVVGRLNEERNRQQ